MFTSLIETLQLEEGQDGEEGRNGRCGDCCMHDSVMLEAWLKLLKQASHWLVLLS